MDTDTRQKKKEEDQGKISVLILFFVRDYIFSYAGSLKVVFRSVMKTGFDFTKQNQIV